ncbi:MAG: hypothetical protein CSA35_04760 [Dethiosulfovibrio peptidovorans]|nr:MAG: hypothetical protein CSA35_04760 [Dethiosulfovibrio peptidovorans]
MIISSLLKRNLQILQTYQPLLAKRLEERAESLGEGLASVVSTRETPQGNWHFWEDGEPFFQSHLERVPSEQRKKHQGECVFFVHGVGVPPYLFHVLRGLPDTALAVVVVEPCLDRVLHTLSLTSVYSALPQGCRISFVLSADQGLLQEALGVNIGPLGIFLANDAVTIRHPAELEALGETFQTLERELWRQIRLSVEYLGNTAEDTLIGVRNFALNTPWIVNSPDFKDFSDLAGRPCVCVASGPSLDKNVHLLRDVQDRVIIVAADTAAGKLLSMGIRPHFITSIERPEEMYTRNIRPLIQKYPEECAEIVLVAAFVCSPQTVARWPGPVKIVGKAELDLDHWLMGAILGGELFACGASVAHMAVSTGAAIGASAVALIGQDLAYSSEGVSHASNTASAEDMALEAARYENLLEVPGIDGRPVKTHVTWFKFIKIFESFAKRCESAGLPLCDCTQGGALIPGTVVQDLSDFFDERLADVEPFKDAAWVLAREASNKKDAAQILKSVQNRLHESGHPLVQASIDRLADLEKKVQSVSEVLLPAQRRDRSMEAATLLDHIHEGNSPLAFIGQSYTYLSGAVLAANRSLETMEEVYRWRDAYQEIIDGHRVILTFFSQWFFYVAKAAYWYGQDENAQKLLAAHEPDELLEERAAALLDELQSLVDDDRDEDGTELVRLSVLMDKLDEKYIPQNGGETLWRLALCLEGQGRCERAVKVILEASSRLEGIEMEEGVSVAFLKDMARILSTPDLTHVPPFRLALSVARNLLRYERDEDFAELEQTIKDRWHLYLDTLRTAEVIQKKNPVEYYRLLGDLALLEGRFGEALRQAWNLVQTAAHAGDSRGFGPAQWLCRYLDMGVLAEDDEARRAADEIIDAIVQSPEPLGRYRPTMSPILMKILQERGLNISFETAETESEGEVAVGGGI